MSKTCSTISPGVITLLAKKRLAELRGADSSASLNFDIMLEITKQLPIKDWGEGGVRTSLDTALGALSDYLSSGDNITADSLIEKLIEVNTPKNLFESNEISLGDLANVDSNNEKDAFLELSEGDYTPESERKVTEWGELFFKNAIYLLGKTFKDFTSKRLIFPALLGEGSTIPASENYKPLEGVNRNIKDAKVKLLKDIVNLIGGGDLNEADLKAINDLTNESVEVVEQAYEYMKIHENVILNKLYNHIKDYDGVELTPALIQKASIHYKRLDHKAKNRINAYLSYVQYVSFDFLMGIKGDDVITVNNNTFYDAKTIKYDYHRSEKKTARIWNPESISDHAETQATAVKLLLDNTPIYNHTTGAIIEDVFLSTFKASEAWAVARKFYTSTDPDGVFKAFSQALADNNVTTEHKNIISTLLKLYFDPQSEFSLAAKSTLTNGDLLNVMVNHFRTQVSMNFSEVQEKGKGNFTLVSLNDQLGGGHIIAVQTGLKNSFDIFINSKDFSKRSEIDLETATPADIVREIGELINNAGGFNNKSFQLKSPAEVLIESYTIEQLKALYKNARNLHLEICEAVTAYDLTGSSNILERKNERFSTNIPLTNANFAAIADVLAAAKAMSIGFSKKATIRNSHNTTNASVSKSNLISRLRDQFNIIRNHNNAINNNFQLFGKNPLIYDPTAYEDIVFRGDIASNTNDPVLNAKASVAESTIYNIIHFYAEQLANNKSPYFDFTNFSDKTLNGAIRINKKYFAHSGLVNTLVQETLNKKERAFIEMQKDYLNKSAERILTNYQMILDYMASMNIIEAVQLDRTDNLAFDLIAMNEILEGIFSVGRKFDVGGRSLNNSEMLNLAAARAGTHVINYLDYNDNTIKVKDTLIKEIIIFNDQTKASKFLESQFKDFDNGLSLNNTNLAINATAIDYMVKASEVIFGKEHGLTFPSVDRKGGITGKVPIEFKKAYFYDWLLASNATMNATAGHCINQKAAPLVTTGSSADLRNFANSDVNSDLYKDMVQDHLKILSKLWQAQTKRNVIFTAAMLNYNINTKRGLKDGANVAFVNDLETKLKPIGVGAQKVTDWDGASIGFMHHMIRLYRSLGGHFSSEGGVDQKSFINFLDPLTGSSTLIKHALFAMTPGVVRASMGNEMDIARLYENTYRRHSLEGINILEGASEIGDTLTNPKNLYYYDEFSGGNSLATIYKIDQISYLGGDTYKIVDINLSNKDVKKERVVVIKNMWDLMTALNAFRTLVPSNNKTNYSSYDSTDSDTKYFTSSFGAFEYLVDVEDANTNSGLYKEFAFLDKKVLATEILTESISTGAVVSPDHVNKMRAGYAEFISTINKRDKAVLKEVLQKIVDKEITTSPDVIYFAEQTLSQKDSLITRAYQPLKGIMTDMVTTYGGAKVGQNNLNSLQTLLNIDVNPDDRVEGVNSLLHSMIKYENGGIQGPTDHDPHHAELSMPKQMLAALNFSMLEGERAQELNQIFSSLVLENIQEDLDLTSYLNSFTNIVGKITSSIAKDPKIIGQIKSLINNPNASAGEVLSLTDKLNTSTKDNDIMNLVSAWEVNRTLAIMREASDQELNIEYFNSTLKDVITNNRKSEHIADNVAKKFSELLVNTEDVENISISSLLIDAFRDNIPIDHSTILKEAVSALASSFSNKAARLKFDGLLAVIQPASKMIQVVEIEGEPGGTELYSRVGNAINRRLLKEGEKSVLIGEQVSVHAKYSNTDPEALYSKKRELKGPELIGKLNITEEDGSTTVSDFIGSVLDVDNNGSPNSQFATSLAIDGLEVVVKNYTKSVYEVPTDKNTLGLLNYWAYELGLEKITDPKGLKNLIKTIQVRELGLKILTGQSYDDAVAEYNKTDNLVVRTQRALGSRAKKSIDEDIASALETGKPKVSEYITPEFWKNKTISDLKVTPGEIVAPMLFAEQFLLREGDDFNNVSEEFFLKRLIEKRKITTYLNPPARILISNSAEPVLIYNDKSAFDGEVSGLPRVKVVDGYITNAMGQKVLKLPEGVNSDIYRNSDNNLIILIDSDNSPTSRKKAFDTLANLKGELNSSFKSGYKIKKYIPNAELESQLKYEAHKMWEAFKLFNEVTGARIPGQHYQSFQYLKVVGWINDKQSAVWVPRATTLFAGSDFDVDKLNIIYRSINRTGQLAVWHPLMSTLRDFQETAYVMPTPEKLSRSTFNKRYVNSESIVSDEMLHVQDSAALTAAYIMESLSYITGIEDKNELKNYLLALAEAKGQQLFELLNEAYEYILESNIENNAAEQAIELLKNSFSDLYKLLNSGEKIGLLVKDYSRQPDGRVISSQTYEPVKYAKQADNNYEVSTKGDSRFSALKAGFAKGTIIDGHDVGGRTIESVYQHGIKQNDWITDNNKKTGKPGKLSKLYNPSITDKIELENFSYEVGYLPLWEVWAEQNPELIEELREKSKGKVLTDQVAKTAVTQARALADILNKSNTFTDNAGHYVIDTEEALMVNEQYNALVDFLYIVNRATPSISGYKNAIINQKDKITKSPRTFVAASSPMSMDDLKMVAKEGEKATKNAYKQVTPYNPNAPVIQHVNNMVGKDSVGVVAVALKAYSGVTIAYKSMLDNIRNANYDSDYADITISTVLSNFAFLGESYEIGVDSDLTKYLDPSKITGEFMSYIPNKLIQLLGTIYDNRNKKGDFENLEIDAKVNVLKEVLFKDKYRGDSAEFKSELLSAATDNAKELLISKLGIDDSTIKVYATAMALGIPPTAVFSVMNSPSVKALTALTKSNVFDVNRDPKRLESIINSILKFEEGEKSEKQIQFFNTNNSNYNLSYTNNTFVVKTISENGYGIAAYENVPLDINTLKNLGKLFSAAEEFSLLGGLFGVNQGLKSDLSELLVYRDKLTKYMDRFVDGFDYDLFISAINKANNDRTDPIEDDYIRTIVTQMNLSKTAYNVPAIIAYNPTFAAQMMTVVGTSNLLSRGTLRYSMVTELIKVLESRGAKYEKSSINAKMGDSIIKFSNDVLTSLFLATNRSISNISGDGDLGFTLNTPEGRARFVSWVNEEVLPNIKNEYADNPFLSNILVDSVRDPITGKETSVAKVVNVPTGKTAAAEVSHVVGTFTYGIKELKGKKYKGFDIVKLLELYNFVVYREEDSGKAWGKYIMMEAGRDGLTNTISGKYVKFLQQAKNFHVVSDSNGLSIYDKKALIGFLPAADILKYSRVVKTENIYDRAMSDEEADAISAAEAVADQLYDDEEYVADGLEEDVDTEDFSEQVDDSSHLEEIENEYGDQKNKKEIKQVKMRIVNKRNSSGKTYQSKLEITTVNLTKQSILNKALNEKKGADPENAELQKEVVPAEVYTEVVSMDVSNSIANSVHIYSKHAMAPINTQESTDKRTTIRATKLLAERLGTLNKGVDVSFGSAWHSHINKNSIFFNYNTANHNTVIHEFGHALLALLKYDNPNLHRQLLTNADSLPEAEIIRNKYKNLSNDDLIAEEIVVNALANHATSGVDLDISGTENKNNLDEVLEVFSGYIEAASGEKIPLSTQLNRLLYYIQGVMHSSRLVDITKPINAEAEIAAVDKILTELNIKCES